VHVDGNSSLETRECKHLCGDPDGPEGSTIRPEFVRVALQRHRDTLTLDQCIFENVERREVQERVVESLVDGGLNGCRGNVAHLGGDRVGDVRENFCVE
jgi:hypothetical protein